MNKVILSLLLAVCVLGMALIMLNERLGRKSEPAPIPPAEINAPAAPDNDANLPPLPGEPGRSGLSSAAASAPEQSREEPFMPPLPKDPDAGQAMPVVERDVPQDLPRESATPEAPAEAARQPRPPVAPAAAPAAEKAPEKTPAKAPAAESKKEGKAAQPEKAKAEKTKTEKAKSEKAAAEKPGTEKTGADKAPAAKAAAGERNISRFVIFARDKGATVRLVGSVPIRYKTMTLNNPERVVVDLEGQWQIKAPGVPQNVLVNNVRIGKMADKTRVVIDLKEKPKRTRFVLSKDGDTLDVRLDQ